MKINQEELLKLATPKKSDWLVSNPSFNKVLNFIKKEGETTAMDLEIKIGIPNETGGRILRRLKEQGYLTDRYGKRKNNIGQNRTWHFYKLKKGKNAFRLENGN